MATGSKIWAQIAIIPETKCELCEENEIKWKCFTCEEFLCDICKRFHLKGKATRNHKITSIEGSEQQQQKYRREVKENLKCHIHTIENVQMYCEQCQIPLCRDCIISGSHKNHRFMAIEDIIEDKHTELSQIIDESNKKLSKLEDIFNSIQKNELDYSGKVGDQIDKVKSRNAQLKAELDKITDEMITSLRNVESKDKEKMKQRKNEIENEISDIKKLIKECMEKQTRREIDLVQFVTQIKQRPDQFIPCYPTGQLNPPSLKITNMDVHKQLEELFGYLSLQGLTVSPTINVQVISTFSTKWKMNFVAVVDETHAWIGCYGYCAVSLVTSEGEVIQNADISFGVNSLTVTKSGELLATAACNNKRVQSRVQKLRPDGTFVLIYRTEPGFITKSITVTDDDNIVVCLYQIETKESKLVQLTSDGDLMSTILQRDIDDITYLFDDPYEVCCNRNGDIILLQSNMVVVVDKTGQRRFTYAGQVESFKESFDPWCIVTDKYQHIIISDYKNDGIHLLDRDGHFVRFIWTKRYGLSRPQGISIDKSNQLWICNYTDCMIVKYV